MKNDLQKANKIFTNIRANNTILNKKNKKKQRKEKQTHNFT